MSDTPDLLEPAPWERLRRALDLAVDLHQSQRRKGTQIPYFAHLLGVVSLALEHGADEDEAIAAALHDAVEDQGGAATRARIAAQFGERVAAIVDGCTDTDQMPKPPWKARKEAYIAAVTHEPPSVRLVSACDKLHNARALLLDCLRLDDSHWQRFAGGREGTLWYYRALCNAYRAAGSDARLDPLLDELDRVVTSIEQLSP